MRLPTRLVLVTSLVPLFAGCFMTRGNGEPATEVRDVQPFHGLDVGGVFQVQAEQAPETRVELRGDSNLLPMVELTSEGGTLRARLRGNVLPDLPLQLVVRAPELDAIDLSGAARGEIRGIDVEMLELDVSGASNLRVEGKVNRLVADVSGASDLAAGGVVAAAVDVETSGASSAIVTANESIDAGASGASSITWTGTATKVDRDVSGASSVEHR